jgi:glycosyltransferase involved in cell wall biosynthesis
VKIMVTAASFSSEISGIQRHAFNLVRCLLRRPEICRVDLVVAPWQTQLVRTAGLHRDARLTTHVADMKEASLSRNFWYYRKLPSLVARLQPDLVHLSYPVPIDAGTFGCPTVLTLHDLYPYEIPENFRFPQVIVNRLILKQCLRSVDAIACVSDTTMSCLRQYVPASTYEKALRIYNCVEPEPQRIVRSPIPDWSGESFLLCVAQHRRNKNIVLLLEAFQRLTLAKSIRPSMKLVVVGIEGPETPGIQQRISDLGLAARVVLLRGLSEPELQWCYTRCEAVVVPSKAEGFGLPVAEALLVGCRVLCSDIASLREIGGTHCDYVALGTDEEDALAKAIEATIQEPRKEPVLLPHLSAEVLALEYLKFYRQLLSSRRSLPNVKRNVRFSTAAPGTQSSDSNLSSGAVEQGGVHGCI